MTYIGKATYKNGKISFDDKGWACIKAAARKKHQTPKQIVIAALKRGYKNGKKA